MNVELGSFWLIKDSGCIAIVRSIIGKSNEGLTVVYTVTDNSGVSSYRMSCEYELFTNIAEKLITKSELKEELSAEYVKGKTDGYNEGYQHGFTLAKEKITELDEEERVNIYNEGYNDGKCFGINLGKNDTIYQKQWVEAEKDKAYKAGYKDGHNHCSEEFHSHISEKELEAKEELESEYQRGLKEGKYLERLDSLNSRQHHYHLGYDDALTRMASEEAEKELELKKQGYEEGYDGGFEDGFNTAIKEMSNNQALGEATEYEFGTEDCCEHHKPSKETQKAMQEVLNKESKKHSHYFKDTSMFDEIDTYLLARIWNIEDKNGAYFHAFKKVLDAGKRGNKGKFKDIGEAIDSLKRYLEIEKLFEDKGDN